MNIRKVARYSMLIMGLSVLILTGVFVYQYYDKDGKEGDAGHVKGSTEGEGFIAKGIRIDDYAQGKRIMTISVDTVRLSRKKAGVFRLGFWKVLVLQNLHVDLSGKMPSESQLESHSSAPELEFPDLGRYLSSSDRLKTLNIKTAKGIEIEHLTVRFYREDRIVSTISSDRATLSFPQRDIFLEGHVRIEAEGEKILECNRMSWNTRTRLFHTIGPYRARAQGRTLEGQDMDTDYLLTSLLSDEKSGGK